MGISLIYIVLGGKCYVCVLKIENYYKNLLINKNFIIFIELLLYCKKNVLYLL